jgi:hypothetical protein
VKGTVGDVEGHQHGGVDAPVDVERRRVGGIEENGTQRVRELSARA